MYNTTKFPILGDLNSTIKTRSLVEGFPAQQCPCPSSEPMDEFSCSSLEQPHCLSVQETEWLSAPKHADKNQSP